MYFKNVFPDFYEEVKLLLDRINRNDLAAQLKELEIVWRCPCTDFGCASFRVSGGNSPDSFEIAAPKRSTYTSSLNLKADQGKISLALDQLGRITAFEILNRPDLRRKLFQRR